VFGILARSVFKKRRFNSDGIKDSHKQAAPGVPIIVPTEFKTTPGGRVPLTMDQVYGKTPPLAVNPVE